MAFCDTKTRILDAAEHQFARDGYHATSLRGITAEAKVNIAAVNYHFGSKESLLEAVIMRRLTPLNETRSGLLDDLLCKSDKKGTPPTCRQVLRTFVEPTLHLRQRGSDAENFIGLIGRTLAEPRGVAMTIFMRQMEPLMRKIVYALTLSLPGLSQQEIFWRLHFTIGALSHVMRCHERHSMLSDDVDVDTPVEQLVEYFLDFSTAGMEAKT